MVFSVKLKFKKKLFLSLGLSHFTCSIRQELEQNRADVFSKLRNVFFWNVLHLGYAFYSRQPLSSNETKPARQLAEMSFSLLLHQVKAHRDQRQPDQQIQGTEHQLSLRRPRVQAGPRHVVAEADGTQRDEAEVEADQVGPVALPQRKQQSAKSQVTNHQQQTYRYWHLCRPNQQQNRQAFLKPKYCPR